MSAEQAESQHLLQQVCRHVRIFLLNRSNLNTNDRYTTRSCHTDTEVINTLEEYNHHVLWPVVCSVVCMTFRGLTAAVLCGKLTSFPGLELQDVRPREDADTDTDLTLYCHRVSNKPVLVMFILHLRHCLHHGPAMFPRSVH